MAECLSYEDIATCIDGYSVGVINICRNCWNIFSIEVHKSCPSNCSYDASNRIYPPDAVIKSICDEQVAWQINSDTIWIEKIRGRSCDPIHVVSKLPYASDSTDNASTSVNRSNAVIRCISYDDVTLGIDDDAFRGE